MNPDIKLPDIDPVLCPHTKTWTVIVNGIVYEEEFLTMALLRQQFPN